MANTTWSTTDKTAGLTLSGGNLIATSNASNTGVRGADKQIVGKFYFEMTLTTTAGSQGVGIANASAVLGNSGPPGACTLIGNTGSIFLNGVATGVSFGARASGDVMGIALDLDNRLIWFRVAPSGNWNANAAFAPGGSGGINFSSIGGGGIPVYPWAYFQSFVLVTTANFGDTAFTGAVPSGYTSGFTAGASVPTNALASQALAEHWLTTNPQAQATQVMAEHWQSVASTSLQAVVTFVAVEHWMSVAVVVPASGGPQVTMIQ